MDHSELPINQRELELLNKLNLAVWEIKRARKDKRKELIELSLRISRATRTIRELEDKEKD